MPGVASLGLFADGGDADDAGAVASADDCASSTSHPLATQWCRHAGHFMIALRAQCACVWLHSVAAAATS